MPFLKTITALFNKPLNVDLLRPFGVFAILVKKGNDILERVLPSKVSAVLSRGTRVLGGSGIVWEAPEPDTELINPATGLPMDGAVDVAGNSYGEDGYAKPD